MKYSLSDNYPNPFNPSTHITYTLQHATPVTLKVFDVIGREIATLVNGKSQPGIHSVTWNAQKFPSGVYFHRIVAGNFIETKKMVLAK